MAETTFDKSQDIEGQIPPGPTVDFKVVEFPDVTLGQTFIQYASSGKEIGGLPIPFHDSCYATRPLATQEVYTFKVGGSSGTIVGTLTINYADATKKDFVSVEFV